MDEGAYRTARWGVERAAAQGVAVRTFPHHDAAAARARIERDGQSRSRPVILTDGFCPLCGEPAPIASLLQTVERHGGQLVLDDTQAFGMLGEKPCAVTPFGRGGGGSLKWHGVSSPQAIAGARSPRLLECRSRSWAAARRSSAASNNGARRACIAARLRSPRCAQPSTPWL